LDLGVGVIKVGVAGEAEDSDYRVILVNFWIYATWFANGQFGYLDGLSLLGFRYFLNLQDQWML